MCLPTTQPPADDEEEGAKPDEEEMETNSEGLPSCSVCLCAYEEGEMMRRLPCNHEFHMKCIDQWLTQRTTCPMCRVALVSENQPPSSADPASAAEQGTQGSRVAPSRPSRQHRERSDHGDSCCRWGRYFFCCKPCRALRSHVGAAGDRNGDNHGCH